MGLIKFIKNHINIVSKKDITQIEIVPAPHPCGNWTTLDCDLLAYGYNEPFWSDPYEDDVANNRTLTCIPDDCRAGPGIHLLFGVGLFVTVITFVALYKNWRSTRQQNGYLPIDGQSRKKLTQKWLQDHDNEPLDSLYQENGANDHNIQETLSFKNHHYAQPSSRTNNSPSSRSSESAKNRHLLVTNLNFLQTGDCSSDEESRSEDDYSSQQSTP